MNIHPFHIENALSELAKITPPPVEPVPLGTEPCKEIGVNNVVNVDNTSIHECPPPQLQPSTPPPEEEARPFFQAREFAPQYILQQEQPQHRFICYLAAQGNTNTEIAEKTGYTTATIAYVKKQPWAVEQIALLMREAGREAVINELKGAALIAAKEVIAIIKNESGDAKASDRLKASDSLLNRLYGTATQVVAHTKLDPNELTDEELAAMARGQARN